MTHEKLINLAASVVKSVKMGDNTSGDVGCALLSDKDNVYTGVCIDTMSGMGFCAEHAAIAAMVTAQEYKIKTIVAVWKNEKGEAHVLHPCGRCREFMRQVNKENMETDVILGKNRVVKLKTLLPYEDDFSKA
ncbi:cytidine deaminase [Candidatus Peregrinibacteria bacterium CG_4_10_14_0_2_um_filter_43_11]|nr:MAG: cytidine deaminase [Candidatus Peregrinibacteria bacterium CG_4_10_14_0_2_um_filter_43_11]